VIWRNAPAEQSEVLALSSLATPEPGAIILCIIALGGVSRLRCINPVMHGQ
jgi:hypothetical protein